MAGSIPYLVFGEIVSQVMSFPVFPMQGISTAIVILSKGPRSGGFSMCFFLFIPVFLNQLPYNALICACLVEIPKKRSGAA